MVNNQTVGLNEKRPNAIEPEQNKKMRPEVPDEPVSTTTITDLNDKCLEYIFKELDIKELLSLADSSKYLKPAVDYAYKTKFGQFGNFIHPDLYEDDQPIESRSSDRYISASGPFALRLLRCFGHMLTKLNVYYGYQHSAIDLGKYKLTVRAVIHLLSVFKLLQKLRFVLDYASTNDDLLKHIGSEWRLTTDKDENEEEYITLER